MYHSDAALAEAWSASIAQDSMKTLSSCPIEEIFVRKSRNESYAMGADGLPGINADC